MIKINLEPSVAHYLTALDDYLFCAFSMTMK